MTADIHHTPRFETRSMTLFREAPGIRPSCHPEHPGAGRSEKFSPHEAFASQTPVHRAVACRRWRPGEIDVVCLQRRGRSACLARQDVFQTKGSATAAERPPLLTIEGCQQP